MAPGLRRSSCGWAPFGVRPIDWQNRPTFQQVVAFAEGRP
jgi:hypothetical protein